MTDSNLCALCGERLDGCACKLGEYNSKIAELEELNANQAEWLAQADQPESAREQPPMSRERFRQDAAIRFVGTGFAEDIKQAVLCADELTVAVFGACVCVCAETSSRNCPEHGGE